jgi:hypothetical protein
MQRSALAAAALFLSLPVGLRAEALPSPLRAIPEQADLLIEIKEPRRLVDAVQQMDLVQRLGEFSAFREAIGGTKVKRFQQLVAYVEKELGLPWPALIDQLAGRGVALGVKFQTGPAPTLLVIEGKDEKLLRKFLDLVLQVVEQELARQDRKETIEKKVEGEIVAIRIGNDFHAAAIGATLLLSNQQPVLKRACELRQGKSSESLARLPAVAEAEKLLPPSPLARLWVNMAPIQKSPQAKALYKSPRDEGQLTALVGGYLDLFGRSPWISAGLFSDKNELSFALRLPRGREGMGPDRALFVPPDGQAGSRPLLEPKNVLYSDSSFHDLSRIWEDRAKLFNEAQRKGLEQFDEGSGRFLSGLRLSKLLNQAGAYHRVVVVHQPSVPYKRKPKQPIPAFAFVLEMRDPAAFGKGMDAVLRGAALLALTQVKLKLVEEQHAGCEIIAWRFDEDAPFPRDANDIRFNFSPCFTTVGNQFVVSSTMELCREVVDLLKKEPPQAIGSTSVSRTRLYAAGAAEALTAAEDQLLAQTILDQALPPNEAREQVRKFIALVRRLGTLTTEAAIAEKEFHYDVRLRMGPGRE